MEKQQEYKQVFARCENLTARATELVSTADDVQEARMLEYLSAQEKTIEQTEKLLEIYRAALVKGTKTVLKSTDKKVGESLLSAFARYEIKEG